MNISQSDGAQVPKPLHEHGLDYWLKLNPDREGWIYLIHAEGTDRYKIGRSINCLHWTKSSNTGRPAS